VENICGAVAKTGDAKGCKYGASCRFNHDFAAYLQQVRMHDIQALFTLELLSRGLELTRRDDLDELWCCFSLKLV
jgi:hypothetical protein